MLQELLLALRSVTLSVLNGDSKTRKGCSATVYRFSENPDYALPWLHRTIPAAPYLQNQLPLFENCLSFPAEVEDGVEMHCQQTEDLDNGRGVDVGTSLANCRNNNDA